MSRQVRTAWSVGRPSRRKNEPGIFPAAYAFSSMSTVRGKKSMPSRTPLSASAVTSTTVSPSLATTAPWDCGANLPVSSDSVLSVPVIGADTETASAISLSLCPPPWRAFWRRSQLSVVDHPRQTPVGGDWQLTTAPRVAFVLLLATQPETGDQRPVPLDVVVFHVVEQPTAATDQHQQTPPAVMVLLVDLQVLGELVDAAGEQRHLHLGRTRVGVMKAVLAHGPALVSHTSLWGSGWPWPTRERSPRHAPRPSAGARERRLKSKQRRGDVKRLRQRPLDD